MHLRVLLATVLAVVTAGCSSAANGTDRAEPARDASGVAQPAAGDLALFDQLRVHSSSWNETVGALLADYEDPDVTGDAWIDTAAVSLDELAADAAAIRDLALQVDHDELRTLTVAVADNYQDKLQELRRLESAVARGDTDVQPEITKALRAHGQRGQQLATDLFELLRTEFGLEGDDIAAALQDRAEAEPPARDPAPADDSDVTFMEVSDATGTLYIEVPSTWTDIDDAPFANDPGLMASPDNDAMFGAAVPGVLFAALPGGLDHATLIEDFNPDGECDGDTALEPYEDSFYSGTMQLAYDCDDGDYNDVLLIVASPPDEDVTLVVFVSFDENAYDQDVVDRLIDTFQVVD